MSEPVISLKWVDDDLRQIKIIVADGQEPSDIVYPRSEDCDEEEYDIAAGKMFDRILEAFNRKFPPQGIYSPYGVLRDKSNILANLIMWQEKCNFVSVDKMPESTTRKIAETIKQLALGWGLSNKSIGLERPANEFVKSTIKNFRWLFDFEVSTDSKSLLNINRDALKLEWYVLNHDDQNVQRKFSELLDEERGIGSYEANRVMSCINAYARVVDGSLS